MTMMTDLPAARAFLALYTRKGQKLLCAVSGGLDSMCLLHFVNRWCGENQRRVAAAHFNHNLRGEASNRDARFVRSWCEKQEVPFWGGSGDVRALAEREGLSVEEAARTLRYAFLQETAEREGFDFILTAHHADDNAETMLLNLVRGTGLTGLCGIPPQRDRILRPFLQIPREALAEYAAACEIPHVEDATNQDPQAAARNLLRLQVMPLLKELNPKAVEHMSVTAEQLRTLDHALEEDACRRTAHVEVQTGRVMLSWQMLKEAPLSVRPRMLLRLFDLLGAGRKDVGAVHLESMLAMDQCARGEESSLSLPHGVIARYSRGWLILERRPQELTERQLLPGKPLLWGEYTLLLLDHQEGDGVALRQRRQQETGAITVAPCPVGGRLTLSGAKGSRSIKRLCLDRRIGLEERDHLPAIYADHRLAAVWRLGVDAEFLPEGEPCRFIQIKKRDRGEQP